MTYASTDTRCTGCARIIPAAHGFQVIVPGIDGGFHSFACAQAAHARHLDEQGLVETFAPAAEIPRGRVLTAA